MMWKAGIHESREARQSFGSDLDTNRGVTNVGKISVEYAEYAEFDRIYRIF